MRPPIVEQPCTPNFSGRLDASPHSIGAPYFHLAPYTFRRPAGRHGHPSSLRAAGGLLSFGDSGANCSCSLYHKKDYHQSHSPGAVGTPDKKSDFAFISVPTSYATSFAKFNFPCNQGRCKSAAKCNSFIWQVTWSESYCVDSFCNLATAVSFTRAIAFIVLIYSKEERESPL